MTDRDRKPTPHPVPENWPADGLHHQPDDATDPPPTEGQGVDPHPDHELPGGASRHDRPGHPDQGLPGDRPEHPDQGLPGGVDEARPGHPDHGLPPEPARPGHGLPPTMGPKLHGESTGKKR